MSDAQARLDLLTHDGDLATERLDHRATTSPDAVFVHYGEDATDLTYAETRRVTEDGHTVEPVRPIETAPPAFS